MDAAKKQELTPNTCRLTAIALTDFRNHPSLTLAPEGRSMVVTGRNGVGKTNILEALSLFSPGRGLRGAKLSQLRRQGVQEGWAVSLHLGDAQLGTGQHPNGGEKRLLRCNGETLASQAELTRHLCLLWQTPQMDGLFTQGASEQRRFFDRLVYSFDAEHAARVARYEHYMRERNRLLSQQREGAWVASIEHKMAEASLAIAAARLDALHQLQAGIAQLHPAFPQAEIALSGFAENALEAGNSALVVEESLAAQLAQSRHSDAALGRSSHGAHKMEILVTHREKQMPAELCSTGEQKALLLSLLLAQTQALATRQHRLPILLLDEVVAHLDPDRRQALFTVLEALGVQAFLTGTEPALFEGISAQAMHLYLP